MRGRVEHGFKYYSEGRLPDGRPLCRLSFAARVLDSQGRVLATLVDDNTLREGLAERPRARTVWATDDLRLALLAERICWSARPDGPSRLAPLKAIFGGFIEGRAMHDAFGHPLLMQLEEPESWSRVCEVVTRPLRARGERRALVELVLGVAGELRFGLPREAALHAHYDAAPWRSTAPLRRLILASVEDRPAWQARLRPNPSCRKLGSFPAQVVRVAREGQRVSFGTFAAALRLAGASKECDVNLLGVIERHPRQPTLEVRCLPMSLEAKALLGSLEAAESLLAGCLATARGPRAR